ncbi:MAG: carboxypeptidase regulatory-like domain-containing protein [Dehalococcoidia bacterium]|nr:carboxypeptidase regulatory-like domain-containing protein [Dehalococcoidia bacterium]
MLRAGSRLVPPTALLLVGAVVLASGLWVERAGAQETRHELQVTVVGEDGGLIEGVVVAAFVEGEGEKQRGHAGADGQLRLVLHEGSYNLRMLSDTYSDCTVFGPENPEGNWQAVVTVAGSGSSQVRVVVARKQSFTGNRWHPCHFDVPYYPLQGTILGPGDEPLEGISLLAFGDPIEGLAPRATTGPDGTFALEVPDGSYRLRVFVTIEGTECLLGFAGFEGSYSYGYTGFKPGPIDVQGAGVTGLTVRLPDTPADLCRRVEGRATDGAGEPLEEVQLHANGRGRLLGRNISFRTGEQGAFAFYGPDGTYAINVFTTAGSDCTVRGLEQRGRGSTTALAVSGADLGGIDLVVSGEETDTRQVMCLRPPEVVTTNLAPGWNLVGWTEAEADIAALFEAVPQLESAHAWDGGSQAFTGASRSASGITGTLSTLQPGMGLWLYVGGEDPVGWTREILVESGLVPLAEGWNLVGWSGREGAGPDDIFASLAEELGAVATWDAATGQFLPYVPGAPASGRTVQRINRGEGIWVHTSNARQWLQPGGFEPPIEYHPDVALETRASFPDAVDSVLAYFADRFGLFVPSVEVYVGDDMGGCGFFALPTVVLAESCVRAIAHEYVHAIQAHVAGRGGTGPVWMTEGVANRWSAQYYDAIGDRPYETHFRDAVLPASRRTHTPVEGMLSYDSLNYNVAHVAIDWLATLAPTDGIMAYYRQRFSHETWQEAFESAFGIGVEEFYASFAAHRAEVAAPYPRLSGTVVDANGRPLVEAGVRAQAEGEGTRYSVLTLEDGSFAVPVGPGRYVLEVNLDGPEGWQHAGWYGGADGFTPVKSEAEIVHMGEMEITGIAIKVPNLRWHRVEGVVLGPDGQGLEGIHLDAIPRGDYAAPAATTDERGAFSMVVLGGSFDLYLYGDTPRGRRAIGWYGRDSGFTPLSEDRETIDTQGQDVTGITITFPVDPAASQWRRIQGVVVGPNGEPQEGIEVDAYPVGDTPGLAATTDDAGAFSVWVLPGAFELHLRADTPSGRRNIGSYNGDAGFAPFGDPASIVEVGTTDVSGIRINLPLPLSASSQRRVGGIVINEEGQPWEGVTIYGRAAESLADWKVTTGADGRFEAMVPAVEYQVGLMADECVVGWYEGDQRFGVSRDDARVLSTEDGDLDDLILRPPNNCARIKGTVVGTDGRPMKGLQLQGWPQGAGRTVFLETDESGGFDSYLDPGAYRLWLLWDQCPLDWTAPDRRGLSQTTSYLSRLSIGVSEEIELPIRVTRSPSEVCQRLSGMVVGSDGEPVADLTISLKLEGESPRSFSLRSAYDGTFSFPVRDGSYSLSIASDRFSTCHATGFDHTSEEGRARFTVSGRDVTDMRVTVGGGRPDRYKYTECTFPE